jgi:hypothetical protein
MLGLMSTQPTYIKDMNLPPPPASKSQVDVVADYLSRLRDNICFILCSSFDMEGIHIQWWFAIPSVWDGVGEAGLRASALRAGFIWGDRDIFFITEPVAHVLHCCKTRLLTPQPPDAFLVAVAGEATVDVAAYEVTSGHPLALKQLTTPSGFGLGLHG